MDQEPRVVKLNCCNRKKCPSVTLYADGTVSLVDGDGETPQVIVLDAEQVKLLRETLTMGAK